MSNGGSSTACTRCARDLSLSYAVVSSTPKPVFPCTRPLQNHSACVRRSVAHDPMRHNVITNARENLHVGYTYRDTLIQTHTHSRYSRTRINNEYLERSLYFARALRASTSDEAALCCCPPPPLRVVVTGTRPRRVWVSVGDGVRWCFGCGGKWD